MINFSIVLPAHVRSCVYYSAVSTSDYILALFVACYLLVALAGHCTTAPGILEYRVSRQSGLRLYHWLLAVQLVGWNQLV